MYRIYTRLTESWRVVRYLQLIILTDFSPTEGRFISNVKTHEKGPFHRSERHEKSGRGCGTRRGVEVVYVERGEEEERGRRERERERRIVERGWRW